MFATTKALTAIVVGAALVVPGFIAAIPAFAQSGSAETEIAYRTEYPKIEASGDSSVTAQTEYRLYRPGDTIRVMGSVSDEMRQETEADRVSVQLFDANGSVAGEQQATINDNGEYVATIRLDSGARAGEYHAGSKIQVEASVLGLLDASIVAELESSRSAFVVGAESSFDVEAEGGEDFTIDIASNSNISDVDLDEQARKVSFVVEGETGTSGVTEVTIPKAMLSGEMMVLIDGRAMADDSSDVILKSETDAEMTFEISYTHSEHTIEVTGTNVVPEFPFAAIVAATAIGSIIVLVSRTRLGNSFRRF